MKENITTDKIAISRHSGRTRLPPTLDRGGMDVAAIRYWCLVGENWYRWAGRSGLLLSEAISQADAFTAAEWVQALGEDLEFFGTGKEEEIEWVGQ